MTDEELKALIEEMWDIHWEIQELSNHDHSQERLMELEDRYFEIRREVEDAE